MVELIDYRISYGECVGYCTSVLTVNGSALELVQTSNGPDADERRFTGTVEAGLSRKIAAVAEKLDQGSLKDTYGTPDARDEGAVTVRIRRRGVTEHRYSRGEPPNDLSDLDVLLSPILLGWVDGESPPGVLFDEVP